MIADETGTEEAEAPPPEETDPPEEDVSPDEEQDPPAGAEPQAPPPEPEEPPPPEPLPEEELPKPIENEIMETTTKAPVKPTMKPKPGKEDPKEGKDTSGGVEVDAAMALYPPMSPMRERPADYQEEPRNVSGTRKTRAESSFCSTSKSCYL